MLRAMNPDQLRQHDAEAAVADAEADLQNERLRCLSSETPVSGVALIEAQRVVEQAERRLSELRLDGLDSTPARIAGPEEEI